MLARVAGIVLLLLLVPACSGEDCHEEGPWDIYCRDGDVLLVRGMFPESCTEEPEVLHTCPAGCAPGTDPYQSFDYHGDYQQFIEDFDPAEVCAP